MGSSDRARLERCFRLYQAKGKNGTLTPILDYVLKVMHKQYRNYTNGVPKAECLKNVQTLLFETTIYESRPSNKNRPLDVIKSDVFNEARLKFSEYVSNQMRLEKQAMDDAFGDMDREGWLD